MQINKMPNKNREQGTLVQSLSLGNEMDSFYGFRATNVRFF